ncbi:hypothetical protein NX059_009004 [Plenodomus lindquistii]|nr:hypothetical protein NX059_009004 [Plenodomus lindquistii]
MESSFSSANYTSFRDHKLGGPDFLSYIIDLTAKNAEDPSYKLASISVMATGFIQYFLALYSTYKDGKGPFPLWMHLFYLAHDSTWSYVFALEAPNYDYHPWIASKAIALAVWSFLEICCIYHAVFINHEGLLSPKQDPQRFYQAFVQTVLVLLAFYAVVVIPINLVGPECWEHLGMITNVVMAVGPGPYWLQRGSREGTSFSLAIVILFGTVQTFSPYSKWVYELPSVFDSPVYYWSGAIVTTAAAYNLYILMTLPAKDAKSLKRA